MIDREKVLKGLECCQQCSGYACRNCCPYYDRNEREGQQTCSCRLAYDALTLPKAQEPVKPRVGHDGWYRCGHCNNPLASGERVNSDGFFAHPWPHYCEMCGKAVKWE